MKKVLDTKSSYLFDFGVHKLNLCVILYLSIYLPTLSVDKFLQAYSICVCGRVIKCAPVDVKILCFALSQ